LRFDEALLRSQLGDDFLRATQARERALTLAKLRPPSGREGWKSGTPTPDSSRGLLNLSFQLREMPLCRILEIGQSTRIARVTCRTPPRRCSPGRLGPLRWTPRPRSRRLRRNPPGRWRCCRRRCRE